MATTEQFSLRWNNFHSNMTSGFHDLLEAAEMVDVTLAVDGHFLQAHKIVLSICSPYFKQMFKINPCKHPIVILKDISHENMKDILQFMYMGEVSVLRENLTQFLKIAELLQVKGLTGDDSSEDTSSTKEAKIEYTNDIEENEIYNDFIESNVEIPKFTHSPVTQCSTATKRTKNTTNGSTNSKRTQVESYQSQSKLIKSEFEPAKLKNDSIINNNTTSQQNTIDNILKLGTELEDIKEPINLKTMWNFSTSSSPEFINADQDYQTLQRDVKGKVYCPYCCRKFVNRYNLKVHVRDKHEANAKDMDCQICGKTMRNQSCLRVHLYHHRKQNEDNLDTAASLS
ncbi:protein abrupt-like isoform X3 [Diorhabda carinulata]|uniref:protein abrupt-like isoform X3 n=1 Tax=Diorhabda carinulata TaxID=1163345 RepID=UPI00259FFB27|nr:protein abrupt-like isoform X3 [Diorhabda carinulata]